MRKAQRLTWISLVVLVVTTMPALATVLLPADFTTIVNEAGVIVHGRVVDIRSALTGPRRTIESFITIDVIESLKGTPGGTVTFRVPNGQVGRYRRVLIGAPEFTEGEELVLFLRGRAPEMPTLVGLSQGVYRVRRPGAVQAIGREVGAILKSAR